MNQVAFEKALVDLCHEHGVVGMAVGYVYGTDDGGHALAVSLLSAVIKTNRPEIQLQLAETTALWAGGDLGRETGHAVRAYRPEEER